MMSDIVREMGCRWPGGSALPGSVTSSRSRPSRARRSSSRISASRESKTDSSSARAEFASAPTAFRSPAGREAIPFRISETAPFFPKNRPFASRRSLSLRAAARAARPSSRSRAIRSEVPGKPSSPLRQGGLGFFGEGLEARGVVHGEVRQDLAVHLDARLLQAEEETAVGEPVLPGRGVHAGDPQGPELPFPDPAVAVCVPEGPRDGLLGRPQQPSVPAPEPLGELEDLAALLVRVYRSLYARHVVSLPSMFFAGLQVRQQAADRLLVRRVDQGRLPQPPLPLPVLGGQDVALPGLGPLDPARPGRAEPLVRAPVRLHLRHLLSLLFPRRHGRGRRPGAPPHRLFLVHRRGDDGHHRLPLHLRRGLDLRDVRDRLRDVLQHLEAALGRVRQLPSPEPDGHLHLVPLLQEAADVLELRVQVVLLGLGADLDLLDLDDRLLLPRLLLPLALDVLELPVIHDPAHRRGGHRGHLHQVQVHGAGALERLRGVHDAELFPLGAHQAHLRHLDLLVDSGFLGDGFLLYSARLTVSPRNRSRNASTLVEGSCSPPRLRGVTICCAASRSPTTSAYGTLESWDSRTLYPSFSFRKSPSARKPAAFRRATTSRAKSFCLSVTGSTSAWTGASHRGKAPA